MKIIQSHSTLALTATMLIAFVAVEIPSNGQGTLPFRNTNLPIDQRVDDLVGRMTLEEKVSQMVNTAGALERLDIPAYDWWNETLHGVARAGYATVFPQAIGLAATWDEDLLHAVGDVASTEARAKHHEFSRQGDRGRYKGLTFWSPNINIFRDPRWGRGQETYGEDPYLTGRLGVAFIKGLQGDDPRYLKVAATAKHYAVHSGPEPERHAFDAVINQRDLEETYLPAFRAAVVEGRVEGVMCAYNRTNGEPCCTNQKLYDILRKNWAFNGHVVSDCGAIDDIYKFHGFAKTEAEASALSVKAGTDLSCGGEYRSLVKAVKDGLIRENEIDPALKHLMRTRFRLGMFDPPEMVAYARIPISMNTAPAHRELALKAARESIVLLKNRDHALPLKSIKTLAVIGPNADAPEVLLGNYNGQPLTSVTPLNGIRSKVEAKLGSATKVVYALGSTLTGSTGATVPASATPGGFRAEYFNNKELQGQPILVRNDEQVNFDWSRGRPAPEVSEDGFSARWTGKFIPPETGQYELGAMADDGVRVYLDGRLLVDAWATDQLSQIRTVMKAVNLEGGRTYDIKIEYFENVRNAIAKFFWSFPGFTERIKAEAVAVAKQSDAVVLVLGISPALEGEEMSVNVAGFRGGDRTDIGLPKAQEDLLSAIQATGKPVIVVLLNGSALAVNYAAENAAAILDAWYPGEAGGTAIADVLFGDYNPAGRLPVTFYKSVDQLPPFEDYNMKGRTYRYFTGEPLYPFGFGLSYTKFRYSNIRLSSKRINAGAEVQVSAEVANIGSLGGDEVVQFYVKDIEASVPVPMRSLAGVKRLFLRAGEKRTLSFTLKREQMTVVDDNGKRVVEPGEFEVSVGGKQLGSTGRADVATSGSVSSRLTVKGRSVVE